MLKLELTGLDLGKIKNIIDDCQQGCVGDLHQFDVAALLAGELAGPRQEIDEAADAGQGGADFVAHDREKVGLGVVRVLGLDAQLLSHFIRVAQRLVGAAQGVQRLLALGDVEGDADQTHDTPRRIIACGSRRLSSAVGDRWVG